MVFRSSKIVKSDSGRGKAEPVDDCCAQYEYKTDQYLVTRSAPGTADKVSSCYKTANIVHLAFTE